MDGRDKQRFTRNWSALKERVGGDLDRILDRLLEENIFDVETKVI